VRLRAKVNIDSLREVVDLYEESIGTEMTFAQRSFKVMSTIAPHLPLNISETVSDRGLVPKDQQ